MNRRRSVVFNHDGFGLLAELAGTDCTPADADRVLVAPLAAAGFSAIDWCICSTGIHNCRTRHGRGITRELLERSHADNPAMWGEAAASTIFPIGDVVERYNAQEKDLLDCVIAAGQARGLRVYGNVRPNHACVPRWLDGVPGASHAGGVRKDFRDDMFQDYLLELFEDLLAKGVDGLSLDFERKAPFFSDGVAQAERVAACTRCSGRGKPSSPIPSLPGATRTPGRPMLDQGATAAMEVWRLDEKANATWCHSWAVTPVAMLIRYVMGLEPAEPGWRTIRFAPQPLAALAEYEATVRLPNGTIAEVRCQRSDARGHYHLSLDRKIPVVSQNDPINVSAWKKDTTT